MQVGVGGWKRVSAEEKEKKERLWQYFGCI